jgi:hypothetical protein
MAFPGLHNLQILRGLTTTRSLLSCTADGTKVDLFNVDDGSGRQRWLFDPVEGEIFHIIASGGLTSDRKLLSCTADGTKVDLFPIDDHSGRQGWQVVPVPNSPTCNTFNIIASGGLTSGRKFLSCTADGTKVDLFNVDDGSGRQRWQIQGIF